MPHENAAAAPGASGANATGENDAATTSTIPETAAADLLRYANVPEEAVKAFTEQKEGPKAEAPPAASQGTEQKEQGEAQGQEQTEQGDPAETEGSEEETGEEEYAEPPDEEGDEQRESELEPVEGKGPSWYQKRLSKWTRQKDRLQEQIDELKEQLTRQAEGKRPQGEAQEEHGQTAFAKIDNLEDLGRIVEAQRRLRDWCIQHPDGWVVNEGRPNEEVVTPEQARDTLVGATNIIEEAPAQEKKIKRQAEETVTRQQWHQLSRQEWPELFDEKSEIYRTSQTFLKQYPEIDRNPNRDFLLGLMVEGWKQFQPRMQARLNPQEAQAQQNGTNGNPVPEALKRKLPPIPKTQAPNPPRGNRMRSPQQDAAAAVERLAREGGSQEAAMAAIAAIERQNAVAGATKRVAAPV